MTAVSVMAKQRLPSSLVWNFFTYDKGLDISLRQVLVDKEEGKASTAPVEWIFSTGGNAIGGKRNRLTQKNLEREIFIRRNKKYL